MLPLYPPASPPNQSQFNMLWVTAQPSPIDNAESLSSGPWYIPRTSLCARLFSASKAQESLLHQFLREILIFQLPRPVTNPRRLRWWLEEVPESGWPADWLDRPPNAPPFMRPIYGKFPEAEPPADVRALAFCCVSGDVRHSVLPGILETNTPNRAITWLSIISATCPGFELEVSANPPPPPCIGDCLDTEPEIDFGILAPHRPEPLHSHSTIPLRSTQNGSKNRPSYLSIPQNSSSSTSTSTSSSPSSSDDNSPFSASSARDSDSTIPSATPDPVLFDDDAIAQCDQYLLVRLQKQLVAQGFPPGVCSGRVDAASPADHTPRAEPSPVQQASGALPLRMFD
ncbi:hypothetical protein K503DRAFT_801338 [Rhizopogon vinicolor AM-OR11-026]|uniref:Uncharacterized protein n=1 Tax=Rhizopogon vinicolor AM-OR11-026 TaxID=1314800 RepID=A0A1B7MXL4_9AGAM|nr:hypothetical protein K503DRAFT_801338 [Rhizopogon vinicolor AM-OR11-026]